MPSKYPVLADKPIDKWKVTELREELRRRGLITKGLKEELVKRLDEALRNEMELCNDVEPGDGFDPDSDTKDNCGKGEDEQLGADNVHAIVESSETTDSSAAMPDIDNKSQDVNEGVKVQVEDTVNITNSGGTVEEAALKVVFMDNNVNDGENVSTQFESSSQDAGHDEKREESKPSIEDPMLSLSEPINQVSEVSQDLGFQVKCESNSTDSVSINEKNKLKDNLNADNFHLELEVGKPEMVQPSSSNGPSIGGDLHPFYDDQETGKNLISMEPTDVSRACNVDSCMKKDSVDGGSPEKLNLDRSYGAELVEENMLENKHVELNTNPDQVGERPDANKVDAVDEENLVDEMVGGFSPDKKDIVVDLKTRPATPTETRKAEVILEETDAKYAKDVEIIKKDSADVESIEKLNLDKSLRDESIEEDVLEIKHADFERNEVREITEDNKMDTVEEGTQIDVVVGGFSPNKKDIVVEEETSLTAPTEKRKLEVTSEEADVKYATEVDIIKKEDSGDGASLEKLNLDRSSGDESMEEDVLETKHVESNVKPDEVRETIEDSKVDAAEEGTVIDAVSGGSSLEKKDIVIEEKTRLTASTEKRKLEDHGAVGISETPKRQRRWFPDTVKVPEVQMSNFIASSTPKDAIQLTPRRTFSRSDSALSGDSPKERIVPPSQKTATTSLRIDRFLRPFTLKAVQELLAKTGTVCSFWMDQIKTHCYVTYSSVEEAIETRNAVYNLQWPPNGGRLLVADFVEPQEVKLHVEAPPQCPAPSPTPTTPTTPPFQQPHGPQATRQNSLKQQKLPPASLPPPPPLSDPPPVRERLPPPPPKNPEPAVVTLDDLFKKTKTTPRIYYLPLSEEQVAVKLAAQGRVSKD